MKLLKTAAMVILTWMLGVLFIVAAVFQFLLVCPSVGKLLDADERRALADRSSHYMVT